MRIEVILTPAEIALLPERDLRAATCVVFDVLRATSTMLTALAHGARRIFPAATVEEARAMRKAKSLDVVLGGERGGLRLDGFDLGNSPLEYTPGAVSGREIVMTTTNGTVALQACAGAAKVFVGALLNLTALAAAISRQNPRSETLYLICAGTGENFALEDGLAAGALLAQLSYAYPATDAVVLMESLYAELGSQPLRALQASSNARRLVDIGLAADVDYCAQIGILDVVAMFADGAVSIELA